ncbi:MAG: glycine cleavage system protein H, partial [Anaerolineales bacterium]|nr:glycine cleavage system protein H [Anaerolineales bacterium]
SDIVYLELPNVGDSFGMGDTFGVVESVKAAADLFMPISGEVTAVNEDLIDTPELVNSDPYGAAWMVKIKLSNPAEIDDLMDADTYTQFLEERD